MPGLVALLMSKYDESFARQIAPLAEAMHHEAFYKTETLHRAPVPLAAARVHLNHVNRDPQPIYNEDQTLLILMDGELHGREGLKERLTGAGHVFQTNSDAELLLHLYEESGESFPAQLNGWFLALIHSIPQRKTLIVNDCFGMYRAYYTEQGPNLALASELKCLLRLPSFSPKVHDRCVAEYFAYDAVLEDRTLLEKIHRLPPGSLWTYQDGSLNKTQYYQVPAASPQQEMTEAEFLEQGYQVFQKIIPRYLTGQGLGLSLTGGWDTRSVLSALPGLGLSIPCYTFSGQYRENLDVRVSRKVAQVCGQKHRVVNLERDFLDHIPDYAVQAIHFSDGTADLFKCHELYLNRQVRSFAPLRVTGKYGSQFFGGLVSLKRRPLDPRIFSDALSNKIAELDSHPCQYTGLGSMLEEVRWLWGGYLAIEMSQVMVRTPYTDKDFIHFAFKAPSAFLSASRLQKYIVKKNSPALGQIPSDKGIYAGPENVFQMLRRRWITLIVKMDKAYNWHRLPHSLARVDHYLGWIGLQRLFIGYNQFIHYRLWLNKELRDFARKMLLEDLTLSRPYYNGDFIRKMTSDHFEGRANYTNEIGKVLSFEIWHRLSVDRTLKCHPSTVSKPQSSC